jgi:hypothetical protein
MVGIVIYCIVKNQKDNKVKWLFKIDVTIPSVIY